MIQIPYNRPYMTGRELHYISEAHHRGALAGDGYFTKKCHDWLEQKTGCAKALLTHSCTAALEMAALLIDVRPGDEIIMPSFTFVSTANAFVLRGGIPVFVDIRQDTLNLDETKIEAAITPRTKAVVPVHYAGVGCEMDTILEIAQRHKLYVVEDAAQGIMADYKGRPLGSLGHFGALSFHETKNVISGEGGALLVNERIHVDRAEIIREKGTNRSKFFRGEVDKYSWVDAGSSYLPGELIAAFLYAQLEEAGSITAMRMKLWQAYYDGLAGLEAAGKLRRPVVPEECGHNAHIFYVLAESLEQRTRLLRYLKDNGIHAIFHYVPLHASEGGRKYCRTAGDMTVTEQASDCVLRLPLWIGLPDQERIIGHIYRFFE